MNDNIRNKQKIIMIAEDDPGIVDVMKIMLEMEGYKVIISVDGAAVKDMKKVLPDLLLLDIWMAGMDGKEICKLLKNTDRTKNIPIIMISASKDIEKAALNSGADGFLAKPFEMDNLLNIVSRYIGKSR